MCDRCPVCNSASVVGKNFIYWDTEGPFGDFCQVLSCTDCLASWKNYFTPILTKQEVFELND